MQNLRVIENELVPVYVTSTGEKVVYGTELYEVLGAKSNYRDWVRNRLNDIDAIENEDFEAAKILAPSGQKLNQHIIKLDTAKEMAMLERNEKGKQVRRYFIQVERKYKQGVRPGLSQGDYLKLIEIVSSCRDDRFPYINAILENMGIQPAQKRKPAQAPTDDSSISSFVVGTDVMNRPTNDVYAEYMNFCDTFRYNPVCKIMFSKTVNRILGLKVIDKKVNGRKRRVFVSSSSDRR